MRYLFIVVGLIVAVGALAGIKGAQISKLVGFGQQMQKLGPPPEAVNTTVAEKRQWPRTLSAVATVVSSQGVDVSNDAPGVVSKIRFESGDRVRQGQVLVELDSSVERAQLSSVRARLELARQSLARSRALSSSGVATQAEVDVDESQAASLAADARALEAQIERKLIRAPFRGRLGIRAVNLGKYLPPGTTVTVLESTDQAFVDFTVPQRELSRVAVGMPVRLLDSADETPVAEGTISALSPAIDARTRSASVRAAVSAGTEKLSPGMFVNVQVIGPEEQSVVVVPLTAVVHAPYGDSVFLAQGEVDDAGKPVLGPDGEPRKVARQAFVRVGRAQGDFVAIEQGIEAGQEVISAGAFKLRNGARVAIENDVGSAPELAPKLDNR